MRTYWAGRRVTDPASNRKAWGIAWRYGGPRYVDSVLVGGNNGFSSQVLRVREVVFLVIRGVFNCIIWRYTSRCCSHG